jgi:hypothetical protein
MEDLNPEDAQRHRSGGELICWATKFGEGIAAPG